jgi:hypothetical protein
MECRFVELGLDFKGQDERLTSFLDALRPKVLKFDKEANPAKVTQPCEAPISWRLWIEGDPTKPEKCKLYARAQWKSEESPIVTSASNGCLGVDMNMWGISVAYVNKEGNKPSRHLPFVYDHKLDWTSSLEKNVSSDYILHQVSVAAKVVVVDGAAKIVEPLALECLDFAKKKAQLRYENTHKDAKPEPCSAEHEWGEMDKRQRRGVQPPLSRLIESTQLRGV